MLSELFAAEFEIEIAKTRAMLERVPLEKADWKPHEKSLNMGDLAFHIANLVGWTSLTLTTEEFDTSAPGNESPKRDRNPSREDLLKILDEKAVEGLAALKGASDEDFAVHWALKTGDTTHFSMPRTVVIRNFVFNHLVHHRAQLGVYLRINDVPLPMTYGPSADEGGM